MDKVKAGEVIAVWVSCGAASAAAAILACRMYGDVADIRLVNNPIAEEHEDNQRFVDDLSAYLGRPIERIVNPAWPSASIFDVFEKRRYMSGVAGAPCTGELKKKARQHWEGQNRADWHVMGFTAEERHRHDRFTLTERENVLPILIDRGMTKDDCGRMLVSLGLRLPEVYSLGMPNANCVGCVKASSPTYWNLIRKIAPERFAKMSEMSRDIGAKLVELRGERIFLDELPQHAKGGNLKKMDLDCGFFCEEKWSVNIGGKFNG